MVRGIMPVWSTRNLEYGWYSAEREVELSVDGGIWGAVEDHGDGIALWTGCVAGFPADPRFSLVVNGEPWSIQGSRSNPQLPRKATTCSPRIHQ